MSIDNSLALIVLFCHHNYVHNKHSNLLSVLDSASASLTSQENNMIYGYFSTTYIALMSV